MNVDNIEIKPKEVDFNKMVEEELAKLGDNPNMDTQATPNKPKIKYERKTEKYLEKYKVSKPTETKQYKYYTDNFEKENDSAGKNEKTTTTTIITPKKKKEENKEIISKEPPVKKAQPQVKKRETIIQKRNAKSENKVEQIITPTTIATNEDEENISFDDDDIQITITKKPITSLTSISNAKEEIPLKVPTKKNEFKKTAPIIPLTNVYKNDLDFEFKLDTKEEEDKIKEEPVEEKEESLQDIPEDNITNKEEAFNIQTYLKEEKQNDLNDIINNPSLLETIQPSSPPTKNTITNSNIPTTNLFRKPKQTQQVPSTPIQEEIKPRPNKEIEYSFSNSSFIPHDTAPNTIQSLSNVKPEPSDDHINEYQERLIELNQHIQIVKNEKQKVLEMKNDYERLTKKLREDIMEYSRKKEQEKFEFEKYKEEELKKIEREKKVQYRNIKSLQTTAQMKKDKEENEFLKSEVLKLKEELKAKDQRNKLAMDRLRRQYEESLKKIDEMQKDIDILEEKLKNATKVTNKPKPPLCANTYQHDNKQINSVRNRNKSINKEKTTSYTSTPIHNSSVNNSYTSYNEEINPNYTTTNILSNIPVSNKKQQQHKRSNSFSKNITPEIETNTNIITNSNPSTGINFYQPPPNNEVPITHNIDNDEQDPNNYEMVFLPQYDVNSLVINQECLPDGKVIKIYENGKKEVFFQSGLRREIFPDGYMITHFLNGDIKQIYPDKKEVYYFAKNSTIQTKFPSGLQVFKFPTGQIEKNYPDQSRVIKYPDGTLRNIFPDKYEEVFFPDGSLQKNNPNGVVTIDYENGVKDTRYPDGTEIREFPDGKVCKTNPDGTKESYYK